MLNYVHAISIRLPSPRFDCLMTLPRVESDRIRAKSSVVPYDKPDFARSLFDENGDALLFIDPETDIILDANETCLRLTGYKHYELVGALATDLFRAEDTTEKKDRLRNAAGKTTVFHGRGGFSMRIKNAPGWLTVTVTITRLRVRPKPIALYTIRDDTDRQKAIEKVRQAKAALLQSEAHFRALVEKTSDGIMVLEKSGIIRYASPAATRILGHSTLALEVKHCLEFVHPDYRGQARDKLEEVLNNPGSEIPSQLRVHHADGRVRDLEIVGVNRLDDPNVFGIVLNFRDSTDRRRAELELRHHNALMRTLLNAIPDVIAQKDQNLLFTGGNAAFEYLAGIPIRDAIGKPCDELFPQAWAARLRMLETSVILTGNQVQTEEWIRLPDGQDVLMDFVISAVRDDDGGVVGLVLVGRDGTTRKRLEEQLRQSQKMDAVGQLAGGVAHDFNNLLTVVLGNLELARESTRGQAIDDLLRPTEKAARRAADLTSQLLGFARRTPLQFQPVDPAELIREVIGLLRRTFDPRIIIESVPRPNSWWAWADSGQVTQILMNLCINARDAMGNGGRLFLSCGNVPVEWENSVPGQIAKPGDYVRFRVRDTGVGMTPEVRSRVFEPFFTTKETGQGTGLGLAVVFGIVQAHEGWIDCYSEPGQGTTFDVYLPRYRGEVLPMTPTPTPTPSPLGQGERILVADDERMVRNLTGMILKQLGYTVVLTEDGQQAVEAFAAEGSKFDLVILDLTMPNLSGLDALRKIRQVQPDIPVILASGYSADRGAVNEHSVQFLDKPFSPTVLGKVVRDCLDKRVKT
jgi:two-component system, cell cycle sensor histidine kinase and response regulator CckA